MRPWRLLTTTVLGSISLQGHAAGVSFREALLQDARDRINVFYADQSNLDPAKSRDGIAFRLSKDDKACGGDGVPLTFLEFDVEGARPVDVFNVLADSVKQPQWDQHCQSMTPLGDVPTMQARGYAGVFPAPKPIGNREAFEWQLASANFTTEEFWIVFTTLENDVLRQKRSLDPGALEMQNCLCAYKITPKAGGGAHVINTQQVNSHPPLLSERVIADQGWGATVDFGAALRGQAGKQAKLQWPANETILPDWMLSNAGCVAPRPSTDLRDSMMQRSLQDLHRTDKGQTWPDQHLPSGIVMHMWHRTEDCVAGGLPSAKVPHWYVELQIPNVQPEEVFNVLVDRASETKWYERLTRVNVSGFQGGARGLHEALSLGPKSPRFLEMDRELWEWQAAQHFHANHSYVIAVTSSQAPTTPPFDSKAVTAAQCLEAYEITSVPGQGTLLRFSTHLNGHSHPFRPWEQLYLNLESEPDLVTWAHGAVTQAQAVAHQRQGGQFLVLDAGALSLLEPPPPDRNDSMTLDIVVGLAPLRAPANDLPPWLRAFSDLNLPLVLDSAAWGAEEFPARAQEVLQLFQLVAFNATEEEAAAFAQGAATDTIQLQQQGEALGSLQLRVIANITAFDCGGPGLPDINKNQKPSGLSLPLVIGVAVALGLVMAASVTACCCKCRQCRKRRRDRLAVQAATALLGSVDSARARAVAVVATVEPVPQAAKEPATSGSLANGSTMLPETSASMGAFSSNGPNQSVAREPEQP